MNAVTWPFRTVCRYFGGGWLFALVPARSGGGSGRFIPAQNRDIPPLTQKREAIKRRHPHCRTDYEWRNFRPVLAESYLGWADGVMIGWAAYHQPRFLSALESAMCTPGFQIDEDAIVENYRAYILTNWRRELNFVC